MKSSETLKTTELQVSEMAENLVGSEIIKLAGEIRKKMAAGEQIYNFTIGDFNPAIFPIPQALKSDIIAAYGADETNYPAANGLEPLREAVAGFIGNKGGFDYAKDDILIAGGARPLIYATYQAVVDPGDTVVFPVPSWNNNHYSHLSSANAVFVETTPENHFMPTAADLAPHIESARLIAVCSPLNPTGTTFSKEGLTQLCQMVVAENERRSSTGEKPLYLLFDQIYWILTHGDTVHYHPVEVVPEVRPYTIYIDGLSKAFAATGVRVGWGFGPTKVIGKMRAILGHVGAWSPRAEQVATASFLNNTAAVDSYLADFKAHIAQLLNDIYAGFQQLKSEGFAVDAIAPQAAIYLTVRFNLKGKTTNSGKVLETTADVTQYILNEAGLGIVPFYAFGASRESDWFRLSVGTAKKDEIDAIIAKLRGALQQLH